MEMSVTEFKAKCLGVIDQVQKEKSSVIITRHGQPAAELIPISDDKSGKLYGRSRESTFILSELIKTGENWDAENWDAEN